MARPTTAMPAPASSAARPQSAEAMPLSTVGGVRAACLQDWKHAAAMSRTPHSSQPVTIACAGLAFARVVGRTEEEDLAPETTPSRRARHCTLPHPQAPALERPTLYLRALTRSTLIGAGATETHGLVR